MLAARWRATALSPEPRLLYADSSALVKLVIEESESAALASYLERDPSSLIATSRVAVVEVSRATALANPASVVEQETARLLSGCLLIDVTEALLRAASRLASATIRTLDAIHLASALRLEADELLAYDRRLIAAAEGLGLAVGHPGTVS